MLPTLYVWFERDQRPDVDTMVPDEAGHRPGESVSSLPPRTEREVAVTRFQEEPQTP